MALQLLLAGAMMAMKAYEMHESAEAMEKKAKLDRGNIALEEEAIELREKARLMNEELAEAKVRKDLRRAQALRRVKAAISGADYSSADKATAEGMETQVGSGLQTQRELSGINSSMSNIERDRLSLAASAITDQSDRDKIMGYAGIGLTGAMIAYGDKDFKQFREWATDYDTMQDFSSGNSGFKWSDVDINTEYHGE